jgi:hypothetical protein
VSALLAHALQIRLNRSKSFSRAHQTLDASMGNVKN